MKFQTSEIPGESDKKQKVPYRITRKERRRSFRVVYRNDRKPKGTGFLQMGVFWDDKVIHFPRRKKLKGWQKCK